MTMLFETKTRYVIVSVDNDKAVWRDLEVHETVKSLDEAWRQYARYPLTRTRGFEVRKETTAIVRRLYAEDAP